MRKKIFTIFPLLFFLFVQCFSAFFMWYNHPGPLGLDDAGWYISPITFFKENPLFFINGQSMPDEPCFNFNKILHPYVFGIIANKFSISGEKMFEYNFYIGITLMGIVLYTLFKKISSSQLFLTTALILFAFYSGNGYYHGFFWIVPSFYAILLFLTLIITLFYSRYRSLYSLPIIFLLLLTHSTGIYLAFLALTAFFIHEIFIRKSVDSLKGFALLSLSGIVLFALGEYLYSIDAIRSSFTSTFYAYSNTAGFTDPQSALQAILDTVKRYRFTKYFYGIFTPLLIYSLYQCIKNKKYILLVLFALALVGLIILSPFTQHSYRFFYPLEILTWLILAYGITSLIESLFQDHKIEANKLIMAGQWLLAGFSLLFLYDAIHLKADRDYSFKFYHLKYFDKEEFQLFLKNHPNQHAIVFTDLPDYYKSIEGIRSNKKIEVVREQQKPDLPPTTDNLVIIGENRKYYSENRNGFQVTIPPHSSLILKQLNLKPGSYTIELVDSGIKNIKHLQLEIDQVPSASQWQQKSHTVTIPEEHMYPSILVPWHWYATVPWPLYSRPHHSAKTIRTSSNYTHVFTIHELINSILLHNTSDTPIRFHGTIRITRHQVETTHMILDLDWENVQALSNAAGLIINNSEHPLLWGNPQLMGDYEGRLFRLEKNFKDVKAFSLYSLKPNLLNF
ncbi:hypothetical protein [Prosthecochloris sp.]|uniref:hypothetical protein n=1 Tax=Prosthecochloris sp. TaxID=290513 RepID=UPI00257BAFA7|nr:hypothetical protein [Prosthecochloris sp.]